MGIDYVGEIYLDRTIDPRVKEIGINKFPSFCPLLSLVEWINSQIVVNLFRHSNPIDFTFLASTVLSGLSTFISELTRPGTPFTLKRQGLIPVYWKHIL